MRRVTLPEQPCENPFSTRRVRPGTIAYAYAAPAGWRAALARFEAAGRRGQIVGPHGAGKSALLADLIRHWKRAGERVLLCELHDGQRRLPRRFGPDARRARPTLVAVDGYEQLGFAARRGLRRFCRRGGVGLVVTAHKSIGLPDLARCAPSLETVERLARGLLGGDARWATRELLAACFARHGGNVREVLFELYDRYEDQPRSP
jgi:hypothetical protein